MNIYTLKNVIKEYSWGSREAIPDLLGEKSPSDKPQAEMWMGTHDLGASQVMVGNDLMSLSSMIENDPESILGKEVSKKFSGKLPFLFKVLASESALSIQAHPNKTQAQQGFNRENAKNIPIDSPNRNYRDNNHKPELICALTPFWVLCGFRPVAEILRLMPESLEQSLADELRILKQEPNKNGLKKFFQAMLRIPHERRLNIQSQLIKTTSINGKNDHPILQWMLKLSVQHVADIGILAPLFLNLEKLGTGQALYIPSCTPHSYLNGLGIELMANSDNVIRCGLTPKHVDTDEISNILSYNKTKLNVLAPKAITSFEYSYVTKVKEFRLNVIELTKPEQTISHEVKSVEIILCTEGEATIKGQNVVSIRKGMSVLIPACVKVCHLKGKAKFYIASVPI